MMTVLRLYLRYLIWIAVIAFFSYAFEAIYSSGGWDFILTFFIIASLGFVIYITRS